MDLGTILGLIVALGGIALSVHVEGGSLKSLVNGSAALIVFGGSFGAAMISLPLSATLRVPIVLKQVFFSRRHSPGSLVQLLTRLARVARRDGVLALEAELATIDDPFVRRGIGLVVDGTDSEVAQDILHTEMEARAERHQLAGRFFGTVGGLAPTLGVTGTVMHLVHVLEHLDDPSGIGPAIATAFLATLYGVASANIIFVPIAGKLQVRSEEEQFMHQMVALGVQSLQAGDSPLVVTERLKAFLPPALRAEVDDQLSTAQRQDEGEPVSAQT